VAVVEYRVGPPRKKWVVTMLTERVAVESTGKVRFAVSADSEGLIYDPRSSTVELAAIPGYGRPTDDDYHLGDWDVTLIGQYVAEFNPGPGGMALAIGEYYCWIRITDPFAGETVVDPQGTLIVQ
jgi:hypothetical protein